MGNDFESQVSAQRKGYYCTTQNTTLDEQQYCATFDFGNDILNNILALAPPRVRELVRRELGADSKTRRTIVFPEPARLGIRAQLGELQLGLNENFVPFLIREVSQPSDD